MKNPREFENYKNVLARCNMVMLAPAGSELIGLKSAGGDSDEMGITLEDPAQLLGFAPFEQHVYRTAEDRTGNVSEPSKEGDIDLVVYGLRKFTRLALGGNPNLVSMLYVPKDKCSVYTETAKELQKLAPSFLSKNTLKAYLGYMKAQRLRLLGSRGQKNVNRDDLVARHGFDTKYGMHMLRLGIQGYLLSENGNLQFPMDSDYLNLLKQVRAGDYTLDKVIGYSQSYEDRIEQELQRNHLPEKPDYIQVEKWLLDTYKKAWE